MNEQNNLRCGRTHLTAGRFVFTGDRFHSELGRFDLAGGRSKSAGVILVLAVSRFRIWLAGFASGWARSTSTSAGFTSRPAEDTSQLAGHTS